ncbi:MAG: hypothetical protein ACFC03_02355 [Candidatus Malihini olakiniferum]
MKQFHGKYRAGTLKFYVDKALVILIRGYFVNTRSTIDVII